MRLRSHIGTLLFPPIAMMYGIYAFVAFGRSDSVILLTLTMIVMTILAIGSRWFFLRNPGAGVYFFGCVVLLFPFTQRATSDDLLQFTFGSLTVLGGLGGVIFFGVGMIRQSFRRDDAQRGFDVLPSARFDPSVLEDKSQ
jgi:hypothetical protein